MVLFMILLFTVIALIVIGGLIISLGGAIFTVIFSDVIVCIFIIVMIMRWLLKRKKH